MTRFQIRTPKDMVLENLLSEISEQALLQTRDLMDPELVLGDISSHLLNQVRESMAPYIRKFDLCNLFRECSDEVEGAPWLDQKDRIYLLILPQGLGVFYDDLAFEAMENSRHLWKSQSSREIFIRLRKVFRQTLGKYLYFNPVCVESPVCTASREVSPWVREATNNVA